MDKMIARISIIALALMAVTAPLTARAQSALQPTQIQIGAPAQSDVGKDLTVQAVLADSRGHAISGEVVYFTTQKRFMGETSDVVLAQGVTNAQGQAVATFVDDLSGGFTLSAEFRGDNTYAAANASADLAPGGELQIYAEHVGVDIPGFSVAPTGAYRASLQAGPSIQGFIQSLWPRMMGWPVAAVLLLVWSMYMLAVRFVFRVASQGAHPDEIQQFDQRGTA